MPRAFPVRISLGDDESLLSYVNRLSARHDVPLGYTLSALGLVSDSRRKNLAGFGISLREEQVHTFSVVAGISEEDTQSLLLSRYSNTVIDLTNIHADSADSFRKVGADQWAYFSGSHFCPACLGESAGVWKISWKLPWTFACMKHGSLLHDRCPDCAERSGSGKRDSSLSPPFLSRVARPEYCGNVISGGRSIPGKGGVPCGCKLSAIDIDGSSLTEEILATQSVINDYITSPDKIDSGASRLFFEEMRSMSSLILYRSEVDDFPELPHDIRLAIADHIELRNKAQEDRKAGKGNNRPRMYYGAPTSSKIMAAVASAAFSIVSIKDPEKLREAIKVLGKRTCVRSSSYRYSVPDYFNFSPRLKAAFMSTIAIRGSFDRRAGFKSHLHLEVEEKKAEVSMVRYTAKNLPQLMPASIFEKDFVDLFPNVYERFARRFCSIAAVKILGYSWEESTKLLGLPIVKKSSNQRCITILNNNKTYDVFVEKLYKWIENISNHENITDYVYLKDALKDFTDFPIKRWEHICSVSSVNPGRKGGRSKYAATWLWSELTSGDWTLAPAMKSFPQVKHHHDFYTAFLKEFLPQLVVALREEGKLMIADLR